ncbi:MAG: histone H1 [Candidatus Peribacteraceae bacterium]|nr:histone H1 [Candidatus Peribacteraceae bacterium]
MNYTDLVTSLEEIMKSFVEEAKAGDEGRGSKAAGARARKLSSKLTKDLKEFRSLSVAKNKQ